MRLLFEFPHETCLIRRFAGNVGNPLQTKSPEREGGRKAALVRKGTKQGREGSLTDRGGAGLEGGSHTATTGTRACLGCRKPALLDQPRTEEPHVPPYTHLGDCCCC